VLEGEESEFLWQKDPLVLIKTLRCQPYYIIFYLDVLMFFFIFNPLEEYGGEVAEKRHYLRCSV